MTEVTPKLQVPRHVVAVVGQVAACHEIADSQRQLSLNLCHSFCDPNPWFLKWGDRHINVNVHPQTDINCKVGAEILIIESSCEVDLASGSDCTDTCAFFKSLASLKWVGHFMKKGLKPWFTHHGTDSEWQSEVKKLK